VPRPVSHSPERGLKKPPSAARRASGEDLMVRLTNSIRPLLAGASRPIDCIGSLASAHNQAGRRQLCADDRPVEIHQGGLPNTGTNRHVLYTSESGRGPGQIMGSEGLRSTWCGLVLDGEYGEGPRTSRALWGSAHASMVPAQLRQASCMSTVIHSLLGSRGPLFADIGPDAADAQHIVGT